MVVMAMNDDMDVRMTGVEMIDGYPVELRAEIRLHLRHQVAREGGQILHLLGILRRDDKTKLMPVVLPAFEKGVAVGAIGLRPVKLSTLPVAGRAVTLDVIEMGARPAVTTGRADHARLDDDAAAAGFRMVPARDLPRPHEGRAASFPNAGPTAATWGSTAWVICHIRARRGMISERLGRPRPPHGCTHPREKTPGLSAPPVTDATGPDTKPHVIVR